MAVTGSQWRRVREAPAGDRVLAWAVLALMAISLFTAMNAVKLGVAGLPFRTFTVPLGVALVLLVRPGLIVDAVTELKRPLFLVLLFLLLGLGVSFVARNPPAAVFQLVIEAHVQAALTLVLVGVAWRLTSPRLVMLIFLGSFTLSALTSIFQFLGLDFAWGMRAFIGRLSNDPPITQSFYLDRWRALGLAFNPVILGTQACVAFAGFFAYRLWVTEGAILRRIDTQLMLMLAFCALVAITAGNRSPLLGFALFFLVYSAIAAPRVFAVALPLMLLVGTMAAGILAYLEDAGLRVADTNDSSAEGRPTLFRYGWQLFLDRPLGYGVVASSMNYAAGYSDLVRYMENPLVIRHYTLHNYFLLMLTQYGIGFVLLALLAIPRERRTWWGLLAFVPYIAHIAFHNAGPFLGDFLIWYVLPLFYPALRRFGTAPAPARDGGAGRKSWRRSDRQTRAA